MNAAFILLSLLTASSLRAASPPDTFQSHAGIGWTAYPIEAPLQTYYALSRSGQESGVLVVLVQGSGCVPLFAREGGARRIATSFQDTASETFGEAAQVLVVEKPGVGFDAPPGETPGSGQACAPDFLEGYALEPWSQTIRAAISEARSRTGFDRLALVGFSEGASVVAHLADSYPEAALGFVSGGALCGEETMLVARAARRTRQGEGGASPRQAVEAWDEMRADPEATDRFNWGHTFRRWVSFDTVCPREDLSTHPAPVFIGYGGHDPEIDLEGVEEVRIRREAADLPVTVMRFLEAGHDLQWEGGDGMREVFQELERSWISNSGK